MDVTERQLRAFLAVCDEGSITRAAARLFISQPTLSRQLGALEQTLGTVLVERLPRATHPTSAGRSLIGTARAVVAAHADLEQAAKNVTSGHVGELRIGTLYSLSLGMLPSILADWRSRHPRVQAELHEFRHQEDLVAALLGGSFDVAIGPVPEGWPAGRSRLTTEEFVVVLSGGEERDEPLDLAALRADDWVHFAAGNGLGEVLDAACARAGFTPRVALRTEQARAAVEYAVNGLGHALVPDNVVPSGVASHALAEPVRREISVFWRGGADPLARSLLASVTTQGR
ncbi:LysR family transcriptional regulator [Microbacterium sp. SA39]|uniref:LysR family transcriptional regulator n=1 Tax=Microbacterium sp. SA39 TaxID=1263625 RepID=UPI0005FA130F|nr:LysR family transcriptional regulator [Microbacterium sp. SA39]KJQ55919.1 HTH-type transcriptional regulator GltC [Microbacterium sp. SA39]